MSSDRLAAWAESPVPILMGSRPHGTVTLTALGGSATQVQLAQLVADSQDIDTKAARLWLIHQAAKALSSVLIAPLAFEGLRVTARAGQIGLVFTPGGDVSAIWIGRVEPLPEWVGSIHVGSTAWTSLSIIGQRVRRSLGVGMVAIDMVMYEALEGECLRLGRHDAAAGDDWMEQVLAGTGFVPPTVRRFFPVTPDAGAVIQLPLRRVCCSLRRKVEAHSCPTCPCRSENDRESKTEEWLSTLDDDAFRRFTGRARARFVA